MLAILQRTPRTCSTCRSWYFDGAAEDYGQCRANPPEPSRGLWPVTKALDFCGQWRKGKRDVQPDVRG